MNKIRKQVILTILALFFLIMACNTVSASAVANSTTQSIVDNNSTVNNFLNDNSSVMISGKVTKCSNGDDFSGVTVTVSKDGTKLANTTTKSDGTYVLSFQSNDTTFTVTASYPGHTSSSKTVTITNSEGVANFQLGTDDVYVSTTGSDTTGDGTQSNPYATIQKALDNVNTGGTIHLASGTYTGTGNTGLTITQNVTIVGESPTNAIINAQGLTDIFTINSGINVTIKNLTLTNGATATDGAILNFGTITLIGCNFTNNKATNGGAIYNLYGTITLIGCNFTNNKATNYGGAILNTGTITLIGCTFTNNKATNYGGAIRNFGTISLSGCTFTNNTATNYGGAITNSGSGTITLSGCTFTNNTATNGGAIYNTGGTITMSDCTFTNNTATNGGAIRNTGTITLSGCTFTNNRATNGGAIYNYYGTITSLSGCTFTNNTATNGGAIRNYYGTITLSGCNFTNNTANGGAIYNVDGSCVVHFSSFVNNTAASGNAIYCYSGSVNAEYNWWGSNSNPSSQVYGNVDYSPWLYMTITADPSSITYGDTCNVTVSFNNAYDGTNITSIDPADGHIPDGTIVSFNSTLGTFNPTTTITTNGTATTTFTATSAGTGVTNATTDNQTVSASITVNTIATNLTLNNATGYNGKTVNLTATLTDENGNPLSGKTVTFAVDGKDYTAITDDNGIATVSYNLTKAGVYTVTASFIDGSIYANSTGNGTLTVNPTANLYINTKSSNSNPITGETFTITYKLGNYGPDAAENVTITFQLPEGLNFVNIKVDTGNCTYNPTTRTVTWTLDSVPVGDPYLYLTVKAAGDGTYKITPNITTTTYNLNSGDSGIITINVQSNSDNNSSNGNSNNEIPVNAASTISMQKTGLPLNYLILAVLMVLNGLIVPKRK